MKKIFEALSPALKRRLISVWKGMDERSREQFVDQVALSLAIWGDDEEGRSLVLLVIEKLLENGSNNLAEYSKYIPAVLEEYGDALSKGRLKKVEKAVKIISTSMPRL